MLSPKINVKTEFIVFLIGRTARHPGTRPPSPLATASTCTRCGCSRWSCFLCTQLQSWDCLPLCNTNAPCCWSPTCGGVGVRGGGGTSHHSISTMTWHTLDLDHGTSGGEAVRAHNTSPRCLRRVLDTVVQEWAARRCSTHTQAGAPTCDEAPVISVARTCIDVNLTA